MHSAVPRLSQGLKLSNLKPGWRALLFSISWNRNPSNTFSKSRRFAQVHFRVLITALHPVSLLERESWFDIVTQLAETEQPTASIIYGYKPLASSNTSLERGPDDLRQGASAWYHWTSWRKILMSSSRCFSGNSLLLEGCVPCTMPAKVPNKNCTHIEHETVVRKQASSNLEQVPQ
jgi:hypothetical protein